MCFAAVIRQLVATETSFYYIWYGYVSKLAGKGSKSKWSETRDRTNSGHESWSPMVLQSVWLTSTLTTCMGNKMLHFF